jgi:hypothetical protein
MTNGSAGRLYVVATPIGNLGDLSSRARAVLSDCALIAAEDTRHTGVLLKAFGIQTPQLSLHDHNEHHRAPEIIEKLRQGASVALVSDAGTPAISDPGFDLVRAVAAAGFEIVAIPGPCAAIAALSIGALPTDRFCFEHARWCCMKRRIACAKRCKIAPQFSAASAAPWPRAKSPRCMKRPIAVHCAISARAPSPTLISAAEKSCW